MMIWVFGVCLGLDSRGVDAGRAVLATGRIKVLSSMMASERGVRD